MISAQPQTIKQSLNKAYRLIKPKRANMEAFKGNLIYLLNGIDEKESEENVKIQLMDFLKNTFYHPDYLVATKGKTDFVIHTGKEAKTAAGVLFEVKRPTNKADMVSQTNLNAKALHELILYYLRERLDGNNTDVRQLVITNIYEWFIFDAQDFERLFGKNTQLKKDYEAWKAGQKVSANTDHFYREIAKPFLDALPEAIPFTYFNIKDFGKALRNSNQQDDNQLIGLYKILSPVHLLKLPFTNDSNSLDKGFYAELLHLIGLEEVKEGNKKLIQRKAPARRQAGSLLENAILTIESEDRLRRLNPPSAYGSTNDERLFNVALELCITWINRILFLKLLEAQLIKYHRGDAHYKFLNYATIPQYDELNKLFFQVLARRPESRTTAIQQKYGHVPYLNSSLFEPTDLEDDIIRVNSLDDMVELDLHPNTVLRDAKNKPIAASLNALEYLLRFLDAYDFASEGREEIQEESKTLINAAVLGLIFEKINGYKDGSIYTPGFITMFMCRQAIRLAVVQKFNQTYNWQAETLDDLKNYLADHRSTAKILEFNQLLNSLHTCDPAVGSGHFLVSALNEIIAVKADLKLLADSKGVRLAHHEVTIENDELIITDRDTQDIFEYTVSPAANGKSFYIAPETQRVQKTLFHEKQTIIENCLFGVDINPNSVKICRLRLWIELLKNAYYILEPTNYEATTPTPAGAEKSPLGGGRGRTNSSPVCYADVPGLRQGFAPTSAEESSWGGDKERIISPELQTLPNIDINIKQGNSLLSRFALDTDLKEALRGTKYSVAQYRSFVQEYKTSHNKDRKRELEAIINSIKADFRTEIYRNDPKVKKLQKLTGELQILTTQTSIFEPSAKEKKQRQQQAQKLQTDIATLSAGIDEIKSNAIYRNAFEWRFEFPEVLDNDGNFEGFDVVIGNPPYVDIKALEPELVNHFFNNYKTAENRINLYSLFIELGSNILRKGGYFYFINPNSMLMNSSYEKIRHLLLKDVREIIKLPDNIFSESDVIVETIILSFRKDSPVENVLVTTYKATQKIKTLFNKEPDAVNKEIWKSFADLKFNIYLKNKIQQVLIKALSNIKPLEQIADISLGITPYDKYKGHSEAIIKNREFHSLSKLNEDYQPLITGENITRFTVDPTPKEYIKYGNWLGAQRERRFFTEPRIIVRQIVSGSPPRIYAGYTDKSLYFTQIGFAIIPHSRIHPKYLTAVLNSSMINFLHRFLYLDIEKELFQKILIENCRQFPVKVISEEEQMPFAEIVDKIIIAKQGNPQGDTTALEKQINELVYQLYELTPEEIAIVEGS